jgi:polyisoprenoid-binding protein YceI
MPSLPRSVALLAAVTLAAVVTASADEPPSTRFAIDASKGEVKLLVKKRGALKAFAHDHDIAAREFAGTVVWTPSAVDGASVTIRIPTKKLEVLDTGLSAEDRAKVAENMRSKDVLDVEKYPEIVFTSSFVAASEREKDGRLPLTITGNLAIHGVTRHAVLKLLLKERGDELEVEGEHKLKQTEFGIEPFSAVFGTVGVQDELSISFRVVARRETAPKDGPVQQEGSKRRGS